MPFMGNPMGQQPQMHPQMQMGQQPNIPAMQFLQQMMTQPGGMQMPGLMRMMPMQLPHFNFQRGMQGQGGMQGGMPGMPGQQPRLEPRVPMHGETR